jgi:hypothetical protein
MIADRISRAGWTWGYATAVEDGCTIYVVDTHRNESGRFIVRSDDLLTAFLELEETLKKQG